MAKEKVNTCLGEVCTLQLPKIATIERNFITSSFHSIIANRFVAKNRYRSLISSSIHLFIANRLTLATSFLLLLITSFLVSSSLHSQIPNYVPTNGLVGYWPFNGNANDESGNGNHGTVNGATLTSDINNISNQSYSFDGVNDFISIGNIPVINGNNSRSFVAWVKINPGQNGGVIISQGAELFQSGCNQGFHFNATSALADCAYSGCGIITNCSQVRHPYLLNDGNWHQVAVTYSSGGYGGLAFYADGQFISTNPNNCIQGDQYSEFNTGSMFGVNFGKRNDEYFSNCTLDDIAIYNRALTPAEITALYNGTTAISGCTNNTACNYNSSATQDDGSCTYPAQTYLNCAGTCINDADNDGTCDELENPTLPSYLPSNGLVGYWPFNGNANDESGNGNHGTVNGATLTADRNGNTNSAYGFDGNSYIEINHNLGTINDFSIIGNVNLNSLNGGYLVHIGTDDPVNGCNGFGIGKGVQTAWNQEQGNFLVGLSSCVSWYQTMVEITNANNWNQFGLIKNSNGFQYFLNGQLAFTISNSNINQPSPLIYFGSTGSSSSVPTKLFGDLDDIAIYNRALTQEEITALYTGTTSGGGGNGGTAGTPAQSVPQGIPYQAMIRDNNGAALMNTPVTVRFSLRQDAIDGALEYQETHNLTTNAFGLINTHFGSGTATQGTFAGINWSNTTKFIQVEANTGGGFVEMGTQQMMSVPFALKANESNKVKNAGLPVFANNAEALAGGLVAGDMYRTATGDLKIVY